MKVKLFTHNDLDGVSCAILAKIAYGENVDIEYCNYDDVNEKVEDFIDSKDVDVLSYDKIFITDISINKELAEEINTIFNHFVLLDHHQTAEYLNMYDWCKVTVEENGEKTSGTRMFYDYLINENYLFDFSEWNDVIFKFVETVRKYDTWLWKTKYNDITPKKWNDLFHIYGRDLFIEKVLDKITNVDFNFSETDELILKLTQDKIDRYIESKQKQIIEKDILGYKAGVIFAEQYHSEVGNVLATNNPHLDFIVLINPSYSVSYRTVKNINLGNDIAKHFSGGGHPSAAGSPITDDIKNRIIGLLFE